MTRPKGSEVITLDELRATLAEIRARRGEPRFRPSQVSLATEAGKSASGLYDFARRRGLDYGGLLDLLDYSPIEHGSCPTCGSQDGDMRILVDLPTPIADAVRELARDDRRHPRDEVAILVSEALRHRQRKAPRPRPLAPVA